MMFGVGQKVVCIGTGVTSSIDWDACCSYWKIIRPVRGEIYTIRDIRTGSIRQHIRLIEIVNPRAEFSDAPPQEPWWWAEAFRPIVEPKAEISFTVGADPSTDQFDNRRKVRKKVLL